MSSDKFKNAPIHDKKAIIDMLEELEPKDMIEVVELIKSKQQKPHKQQTVVDRIVNLLNKEGFAPVLTEEEIRSFTEMDKEQKLNMFNCGRQYQHTGEGTFKQVYQEIYGGGEE